ncbi:hypothetical protein BX600DRAFT_168116 [Xylariales sp. PMI_506]|nr:hypothetical protein BX600DRAFT_168116 [Xylariales sp. PMI_506]
MATLQKHQGPDQQDFELPGFRFTSANRHPASEPRFMTVLLRRTTLDIPGREMLAATKQFRYFANLRLLLEAVVVFSGAINHTDFWSIIRFQMRPNLLPASDLQQIVQRYCEGRKEHQRWVQGQRGRIDPTGDKGPSAIASLVDKIIHHGAFPPITTDSKKELEAKWETRRRAVVNLAYNARANDGDRMNHSTVKSRLPPYRDIKADSVTGVILEHLPDVHSNQHGLELRKTTSKAGNSRNVITTETKPTAHQATEISNDPQPQQHQNSALKPCSESFRSFPEHVPSLMHEKLGKKDVAKRGQAITTLPKDQQSPTRHAASHSKSKALNPNISASATEPNCLPHLSQRLDVIEVPSSDEDDGEIRTVSPEVDKKSFPSKRKAPITFFMPCKKAAIEKETFNSPSTLNKKDFQGFESCRTANSAERDQIRITDNSSPPLEPSRTVKSVPTTRTGYSFRDNATQHGAARHEGGEGGSVTVEVPLNQLTNAQKAVGQETTAGNKTQSLIQTEERSFDLAFTPGRADDHHTVKYVKSTEAKLSQIEDRMVQMECSMQRVDNIETQLRILQNLVQRDAHAHDAATQTTSTADSSYMTQTSGKLPLEGERGLRCLRNRDVKPFLEGVTYEIDKIRALIRTKIREQDETEDGWRKMTYLGEVLWKLDEAMAKANQGVQAL